MPILTPTHSHTDGGHTHSDGGHTHTDSGHTQTDSGHFHPDRGHMHTQSSHHHSNANGMGSAVYHTDSSLEGLKIRFTYQDYALSGAWPGTFEQPSDAKPYIYSASASIQPALANIYTASAEINSASASINSSKSGVSTVADDYKKGQENRPKNMVVTYIMRIL